MTIVSIETAKKAKSATVWLVDEMELITKLGIIKEEDLAEDWEDRAYDVERIVKDMEDPKYMQLALSYLVSEKPEGISQADLEDQIRLVEQTIKKVEQPEAKKHLEKAKELIQAELSGDLWQPDLPRVRTSSYNDEWGETVVAVRELYRTLAKEGWDAELVALARELAIDVWHGSLRDAFSSYNINITGDKYNEFKTYLGEPNEAYGGSAPYTVYAEAYNAISDDYTLGPQSQILASVLDDVWKRFDIYDAGDALYGDAK